VLPTPVGMQKVWAASDRRHEATCCLDAFTADDDESKGRRNACQTFVHRFDHRASSRLAGSTVTRSASI
jgi:hypothetical protein